MSHTCSNKPRVFKGLPQGTLLDRGHRKAFERIRDAERAGNLNGRPIPKGRVRRRQPDSQNEPSQQQKID